MDIYLIAIAGGSGSGKTWLARKLKRRLGRRACLLSLDDFYRDLSALPLKQRHLANFDHPDAIDWGLFLHCLQQLKRGEKTRLPRYDFATHTRLPRPHVCHPRPVVLIDGLWLLGRPELRRIYSFMVYVECPEELRLARRVTRDQQERGRSRASILRQWRRQVKPMHDQHVAPQLKLATMIVTPESAHEAPARLDKIIEQLTMSSGRC